MIKGLPEKLTKLRTDANISKKELAEELFLSPSIISGYETGERNPSLFNLIRLATYFGCSTDYLLGLTDKREFLQIDVSELSKDNQKLILELTKALKKDKP